uniref:Uncharacterized protein n=1 Tax=viral metagenome TaxID=1070528 RepID=A0A6M3XWY3_9ZZZZ
MSSPEEVTVYVEIPLRVRYYATPAEGDGINEPRYSPSIEIDEVIWPSPEQIALIESKNEGTVYDECLEDANAKKQSALEAKAEAEWERRKEL